MTLPILFKRSLLLTLCISMLIGCGNAQNRADSKLVDIDDSLMFVPVDTS